MWFILKLWINFKTSSIACWNAIGWVTIQMYLWTLSAKYVNLHSEHYFLITQNYLTLKIGRYSHSRYKTQTESPIFEIFVCSLFPKAIVFYFYFTVLWLVLCRVAALESLPVHHDSTGSTDKVKGTVYSLKEILKYISIRFSTISVDLQFTKICYTVRISELNNTFWNMPETLGFGD